jgi:hypothetical protein
MRGRASEAHDTGFDRRAATASVAIMRAEAAERVPLAAAVGATTRHRQLGGGTSAA